MSDYRAKMRDMISKMEFFQSEIQNMEERSLARVRNRRSRGELQGSGADLHDLYHVARDLEDNPWFQRAVGHRNSYMNRATMYALAALVEQEAE